MKKTCTTLAFIATALVTNCGTIQAADTGHGEDLVRRWCTSCHVVAADQQQTTSEAPPFAVIARKPDFSVNRLAYFLLEPHPKLPNMSLSRAEAADIAAYIGSLAK